MSRCISIPGYVSHIVGTKSANELGICDMSGNLFEWVWDPYAA
ncbi:MAG: formylglycine-generating enzyme family protein [Candidatus Syntrophosphaera sp.]|nr:formylglycine-generating enzyme family protein [Candidatus Syntrophosphaera sp.]